MKNKKVWFIGLGLSVLIMAGVYYFYNKASTTSPTWSDLSYSSVSATNKLDIYLPSSTSTSPFPVVVWIHGGAFKMGDKSGVQSLSRLLKEGYAVVSVDYRLSSEAIWPAQLTDMENIVKFLKLNADKYKIDANRIASWGASAGGFLSSIMGSALADNPETRIKATVDWYGPVDFYDMDADIAKTGVSRQTGNNGDADSPESALLGKTVKENKELSYQVSPLSYVEKAKSLPAFLIMHGGQDPMIGAPQSERLYNAISTKFGTSSVEYHLLPNGTHGGGDFQTVEAEDTVINFLKKNL